LMTGRDPSPGVAEVHHAFWSTAFFVSTLNGLSQTHPPPKSMFIQRKSTSFKPL
jgi:hypothetical protein